VSVWGITDGSAGMTANVKAVLEALGLPYVLKTCVRKAPYVWLQNDYCGHALRQLTPESDALIPPWPQLVVTCGRRSAPLGAAIRRASGGKTKAVHLQHPRMRLNAFDLVVPMQHDRASGPNIFPTHFALHRITPALLQDAAARWQPRFSHLPRPYIAVLIGGSTHRYTLTPRRMEKLVQQLEQARSEGSLLITPSRRTGGKNIARLKQAFIGSDAYVYDLSGDNPYLGLLGLADYLIVTDDSVNMMTEAAATGKPLYLLSLPDHIGTKPARFAQMLIANGIARPLGAPWGQWHYTIPDEAERVAQAIRKLPA